LKISDLNILVDPPAKIPFGGSTTFYDENHIFVALSSLKMNYFF